VAKPELGTKRLCASCGAKFYDLNKDPITLPEVRHGCTKSPCVRPRGLRDAARAAPQTAEPEVPEPQ